MIDPGRADGLRARRLLARYGADLTIDLLDHKEADLRGKGEEPPARDLERLDDASGCRSSTSSTARIGFATSRSAATT